MMRSTCAAWLALFVVACGDDTTPSPIDARDSGMQDANVEPSRSVTTAKECFAGIAPPAEEPAPFVQLQRFVTADGAYQVLRAREPDGRWIGGATTNYRLARVWIDGGSENGTCLTDAAAMTYSTSHHNWDDRYTVTTERATYAFHESYDVLSGVFLMKTLEVRDASGNVTEGPLTLLDVCAGTVTPEQPEVTCVPPEPSPQPDAGADAWSGCPRTDDFAPPAGGGTLYVSDAAVYCAPFSPSHTLEQAFAARAVLRFTPGQYALPIASTSDYRLPACVRAHAIQGVIRTLPAQLDHSLEVIDWQDIHRYALDAPIAGSSDGSTLRAELEIAIASGSIPEASLAGHPALPLKLGEVDGERHLFKLCADGDRCERSTTFDSCLAAWDATHAHHMITFEGGDMLNVKLSRSTAPTERASFHVAWGRWRGSDFQQRDRFKLIYAAPSGHDTPSFAVLFDEPIEGACGLRIRDLDPLNSPSGTAATIDCELEDIESIAILSSELPSL